MGDMVVVSQKMTMKSRSIGIEMYVAQTFEFRNIICNYGQKIGIQKSLANINDSVGAGK
jgi:hypothetical protein